MSEKAESRKEPLMLRLPWPPSVNHYWSTDRIGRWHLKKAGRNYRLAVFACLKVQGWLGKHPIFRQPLGAWIDLYPPADRRKRDVDNVLKALLDALQNCRVMKDDSQVKYLSVRVCGRGADTTREAHITLWPYQPADVAMLWARLQARLKCRHGR